MAFSNISIFLKTGWAIRAGLYFTLFAKKSIVFIKIQHNG